MCSGDDYRQAAIRSRLCCRLPGCPAEFPEEVWAEWEADKQEQFEARWPKVRAILDAFEAFGVYLTDVSPANIGFEF